jgi:hypothetical protein
MGVGLYSVLSPLSPYIQREKLDDVTFFNRYNTKKSEYFSVKYDYKCTLQKIISMLVPLEQISSKVNLSFFLCTNTQCLSLSFIHHIKKHTLISYCSNSALLANVYNGANSHKL